MSSKRFRRLNRFQRRSSLLAFSQCEAQKKHAYISNPVRLKSTAFSWMLVGSLPHFDASLKESRKDRQVSATCACASVCENENSLPSHSGSSKFAKYSLTDLCANLTLPELVTMMKLPQICSKKLPVTTVSVFPSESSATALARSSIVRGLKAQNTHCRVLIARASRFCWFRIFSLNSSV